MPAQKRLCRGRTRSKTRALRVARPKLMISEAEGGISEETPAVESHQRGRSPKKQAIMAATPQPGRKEFLGGLMHQNHFKVALLTLFALMVMSYYMSPGFLNSVSLNEYLWSDEGPSRESVEEPSTWVSALHFFCPTTCIPKENQELKACNDWRDLKESECLEYKCCYSSLRTSNFSCFAPLKDRSLQLFWILGFSGIGMMILACLPIYYFSLCQRSKWANPLQRKANQTSKGLKKKKKKLKKDAQLLETAVDDEEELSDKKKQETEALLPH